MLLAADLERQQNEASQDMHFIFHLTDFAFGNRNIFHTLALHNEGLRSYAEAIEKDYPDAGYGVLYPDN